MNLSTALIEHFLNTPFQNFTEKLVAGFQIESVMDFDEHDRLRLEFIEQNTNENIMVSLYILDRFVNPEKGARVTKTISKEFRTNVYDEITQQYKMITIPEDKAQMILCEAIREVCQIVSRNVKGYNDEMKLPDFGDDGVTNGFKR